MFKLSQDGTYANKVGTGEWHTVETSSEYLAWLAEGNIPDPAQTPEEIAAEQEQIAQRQADETEHAEAKTIPFLNYLATHSNAQIRNRVQTLAVDQAGIVDVLEKLAVAVAVMARKELR